VEFCLEGLWGTIDGVGWLHYEAAVVCRQLGFSQRYATTLTYPSIQDKPRAIGFVFCFGDEDFLVNCSYSTFSFGSPSVDAGVSCYADQVGNCSLGDVRLVDGMSEYEGRVEICVGGQWGTVCDDSWGQQEALIVCRQLGYSQAGFTFLTDSFFGNGTGPIFLNRTACNGNEADLLDCSHFPYSSSSCNHGQDSGVICLPGNNCTDGDVRLNGGSLPNEGRVELCIHGVWGTICHDSWDQTDAAVVCRQLGLPTTCNHTSCHMICLSRDPSCD
jgi:deleted-in-malignant-brain-tumors protein 1